MKCTDFTSEGSTQNMTDLAKFDYRFHMEMTGLCWQDYKCVVG